MTLRPGVSIQRWSIAAVVACLICATSFAFAGTPPTHEGVVYASPGPRHELDLYIPTSEPCGTWPVVIYLYGGGWLVGDKADVAPYVDELLARGFVIASPNYRYSYQAIFPAQIHDVKGAIRWLRAHAAEYNLDPDRFAIFGDSAGGHLAALAGTSGGVSSLEGTIGNNLALSSAVQAVGDFAGPTNLVSFIQDHQSNSAANLFGYGQWWQVDFDNPAVLALVQSADPATHASADDPPHFIVHGAIDDQVPLSQAQHLHNALVAATAPSTLTVLRRVGHGIPDANYLPVFDQFEALLVEEPEPGDFNCDGVIDVSDLLAVIEAWGPCVVGEPCPDTNNDGQVNVTDLLFIISNWG